MASFSNDDYYLTPESGKPSTLDYYDVVYSKDSPDAVDIDNTKKMPRRYTRTIRKDEQPRKIKRRIPVVLIGVGASILVFGLLLLAGFISGYVLYSTMIKDVLGELTVTTTTTTLDEVNATNLDNQKNSCSCPPGWFQNGSTCYIVGRQKLAYHQARFSCQNKSAILASPKEESDNEFLKKAIREGGTTGNVWIGLTRTWGEVEWRWYYDGAEVTYNGWGATEPNGSLIDEYCAVFYDYFDYAWGDFGCNSTFVPMCEKQCTYT